HARRRPVRPAERRGGRGPPPAPRPHRRPRGPGVLVARRPAPGADPAPLLRRGLRLLPARAGAQRRADPGPAGRRAAPRRAAAAPDAGPRIGLRLLRPDDPGMAAADALAAALPARLGGAAPRGLRAGHLARG